MCASLPGWTPALQSLPGLESKEVKRSSWEAGVYIVYVYIYIYSQFGLRKPNWHSKDAYTHTETSPLLGGLIHCQRCKDTVFLQRVLNVIDVIDGLSMPRCVLVTYFDIRCAQRLMLSSPGRCEPFPPVRKGDQGSRGVTRGHEGWRQVQLNMLLCQSHGFTGFTKIPLTGSMGERQGFGSEVLPAIFGSLGF